jgi:hypothetical protein
VQTGKPIAAHAIIQKLSETLRQAGPACCVDSYVGPNEATLATDRTSIDMNKARHV